MLPISTTSTSPSGIVHLVSTTTAILKIEYYNTSLMRFSNPPADFTGYSSEGIQYTRGAPDASQKSSWAIEGEHASATSARGTLDRFPDAIFIVLSDKELVIIDAHTEEVWMRYSIGNHFLPSNITLRDFSFSDGLLALATDQGIKIADFRTDKLLTMHTSGIRVVVGTISQRSSATVSGAGSGATLPTLSCLQIRISQLGVRQVGIVSHPFGMTAISFSVKGSSNGLPVMVLDSSDYTSVTYGTYVRSYSSNWSFSNTATESVFTDAANSPWGSHGVLPGDVLILGTDEHVIQTIDSNLNRLYVSPQITASPSGSYQIKRKCPDIAIVGGDLIFANGIRRLGKITAWWESSTVSSYDVFAPGNSMTSALQSAFTITSLHATLQDIFLSTDKGIWWVTMGDLEDSKNMKLQYSSPTGGGEYKILKSDSTTHVLSDVETGHLLVATTFPSVEEIDTGIHQSFRVFDSSSTPPVPSTINTLFSFRDKKVTI